MTNSLVCDIKEGPGLTQHDPCCTVAHHTRPFVHFREHICSAVQILAYIVAEITATVRLPTRLLFLNVFHHQPSSAVRV
ncbi:hypothetical protein FLAG1_01029 [Fusarium langsethiae]|uniref:Uncharacterized protein n=1 Tax=Fusarium langsethiae TaxID=179993 RepID=A0A0M9F4H8_FUSLA|nr:hypothetical protein FLAG1_01029 [Fusarium langsethiae]